MYLFWDNYIVDDEELNNTKSTDKNYIRNTLEHNVRRVDSNYRFQRKIDVCKYTLASYATQDWEEVVIRFECENPTVSDDFNSYVKDLFPNALIENIRSDSRKKYLNALDLLMKKNPESDPWVFFSPNNDHVMIGNDIPFNKYQQIAEKFELDYPDSIVSIQYSHFTESINRVSASKALWGTYGKVLPKILYEDGDVYVTKINRLYCDSLQIFRLSKLIIFFEKSLNDGRVIRLEDTESYLSKEYTHIWIVPKVEICRHYDGYFHTNVWPSFKKAPSPLFIPDGFFEGDIKISYGKKDYRRGWVNINPLSNNLIYYDKSGTDINCKLNDIPEFWKRRVSKTDMSLDLDHTEVEKKVILHDSILWDPWGRSASLNLIFSIGRIALIYFSIFYKLIIKFLRPFKNTYAYRLIKNNKDKFINTINCKKFNIK
jgi:hypothetical protein